MGLQFDRENAMVPTLRQNCWIIARAYENIEMANLKQRNKEGCLQICTLSLEDVRSLDGR